MEITGNDIATAALLTQKIAADHVKEEAVDFGSVRKLMKENPALATAIMGGLGGIAGGGISSIANFLRGGKHLSEDEKERRAARTRLAALAGALGGIGLGVVGSTNTGDVDVGDGVTVTPDQIDQITAQGLPVDTGSGLGRVANQIVSTAKPTSMPGLGIAGVAGLAAYKGLGSKENIFSAVNDVVSRTPEGGTVNGGKLVPSQYVGRKLERPGLIGRILGRHNLQDEYQQAINTFESGTMPTGAKSRLLRRLQANSRAARRATGSLGVHPAGLAPHGFSTKDIHAPTFSRMIRPTLRGRIGRGGLAALGTLGGLAALNQLFGYDDD